jgi:hypothetical protein
LCRQKSKNNFAASCRKTISSNCGLFFDKGNENSLFSALQESVRLEVEEKRRSTIDRFKAHLSFEAISSKLQEIIESL